MSVIYGHPVIAATRALRFVDHVTKRNGGSGDENASKLTPKGLDYTQIDALREQCITDLWFWEVLAQSQSWLRTMQTDLWKLYVNSGIFEFLTPCSKIELLRMRKNVIVFL